MSNEARVRRLFEPEGSIKGSIPTARSASCKWKRKKKHRFAGLLQSPLTDSNRSTPSLPWRFRGVTRVHAITRDTVSPANPLILAEDVRREASRVSFLMCPFRVRALVSASTTVSCRNASRSFNEACRRSRCVSVGSAQHRSRSARRPHSCRRDRERNRARA